MWVFGPFTSILQVSLPLEQFCTKDLLFILTFSRATALLSPSLVLEQYPGFSKPSVLKYIFQNPFFNF